MEQNCESIIHLAIYRIPSCGSISSNTTTPPVSPNIAIRNSLPPPKSPKPKIGYESNPPIN